MKQNKQKLHAGVWLDNSSAIIITNDAEEDSDYVIQDKINSGKNHGGGSEHSIHNSEQSDAIKYFKSVSALLLKYDEIFIFGPGKAQEQLQNHLSVDSQFKSKKITIDSAAHLTDPQMIAKVRDFFKLRPVSAGKIF
jgi:hypothetical protein